ncbi:acylneuraminate cytidylyltransferase [Brevibacterium album]|uniref:acylneuraminate cytidylyltransferase n=1 Tax=Brevibacterium album TaxID=417948 RepID=UPI0003FA915B|nr:acylneuraminate cytidylyltransferase [Brevibacterium album]
MTTSTTPPGLRGGAQPGAARPTAVAIIPARGGSKGIPLKNLQKVAGRTLLARAIDAAHGARHIDRVLVSTDHEGIAAEARAAGAQVIHRPAEIAGDHASSESALLHALHALSTAETPGTAVPNAAAPGTVSGPGTANAGSTESAGLPAVTVFLQCTSPFIDPAALDSAIAQVADDRADVVFSAVEDHSFLWKLGPDARAQAVGHEASFRPRRQDREPHFNETGAFYVMDTRGFLESGHRFFGRIGIEEVPAEHAREIDSMSDLSLVRALAEGQEPPSHLDVDALVTDFDGVHTDDSAFVSEDGREEVRVHRGDGMGVGRLVNAGFPVLILSKERNPVVTRRAEKLRTEVLQGIDDKASALEGWCAARGLDPARVAYVGNDLNDLPAFGVVGWPIAVADAHPAVRTAARLVLTREGGHGAVREVCDLIPDSVLQAAPEAAAGRREGSPGHMPRRPVPQSDHRSVPLPTAALTPSARNLKEFA